MFNAIENSDLFNDKDQDDNSKNAVALTLRNVEADSHQQIITGSLISSPIENVNIATEDDEEEEVSLNKIELADLLEFDKRVKIGSGQFGIIYKAFLRTHQKYVAIKENKYREAKKTVAQVNQHIKNDAKIMSKLDHPNIIKFYGYCEEIKSNESISILLVMELGSSTSMKSFLNSTCLNISLNIKINWCISLADAVKYAHIKNVILYDLKAENVILTEYPFDTTSLQRVIPKIIDISEYSFETPTHLSPERMDKAYMGPNNQRLKKILKKGDVWSFGVLVYEIITQRKPFCEFSNPYALVIHVSKGNTLEIPNDVNPQLREIMNKCWIFEHEVRPFISTIHHDLVSFQQHMFNDDSTEEILHSVKERIDIEQSDIIAKPVIVNEKFKDIPESGFLTSYMSEDFANIPFEFLTPVSDINENHN